MTATASKPKRNRAHIPEIEVPYAPGRNSYVIGKHVLFIHVDSDPDMPNPCEDMDEFGTIHSLNRRHINCMAYDTALEKLKEDKDVIPLSYFEHGRSLWMVQELPAPAGVEFQWDGVRFAGIWEPDEGLRGYVKDMPDDKRRAQMVEYAKQACETYTDWVNGDVYYYNVEAYKLRNDDDGDPMTEWDAYRFLHAEAIYDDSCGGFYGWDYFVDEVKSSVRSALRDMGFSKRAISKVLPVKSFQVNMGRKNKYFPSLDAARRFTDSYFEKTKIVLSIVEVQR